MFFNLWYKIASKFCEEIRDPFIGSFLAPYLEDTKNVLDVGAFSGRLSKCIQDNLKTKNVQFVGTDIVIPEKTFIHVKECDGKKLPFDNNSFDAVIIVDVLHHDGRPEEIIKEAKRVCKKYILIKDHYWENYLDFLILKWSDYLAGGAAGIPLIYNFFKMETWKEIFSNANLDIEEVKMFKEFKGDVRKNVFFKLKKKT